MENFGTQLTLVVGILIVCFTGPAIAFFFLIRRKKKIRARRRSPIAKELLRGPGHSLREQLIDASEDMLWDLTLLVVIPLVVLTLFLAQSNLRGLTNMVSVALIYAVAAFAFIAFMVRKLVKAGARLDNLRAGFDAELAVGQELDQLMRQGAFVFHDVPADNFNIDHVVISSSGVFAVETKGYTKPKQGESPRVPWRPVGLSHAGIATCSARCR